MADGETRFHALDNLRAIMMWLGIVLHVGMHYVTIPFHLPMRDERTTVVADLLTVFIHAFRMPVFFMIAGFLGAMLLQRRGPAEFVRHRMKRLALPFALFWPFLWAATGLAMLAFLNRMAFGRWGIDDSVVPAHLPRGPSTMHMWFLWMLIWFCLATAALSLLPRRPFVVAGALLARLGGAWWGFAVLTLPLLAAGYGYPRGLLEARGSFLPPWNEWLHNGIFFVFGLALWAHRDRLLAHYDRHWARYAAAGLGIFLLLGGLEKRDVPWWVFGGLYNALAWLWGFAWLGLGLRVLGQRHDWLTYLADSAYWVYLLHLPIAIGIAAFLYQQPIPGVLKMLIGIVLTSATCLATYQLFVRHTWVSVLLNGRKHPRRGVPPVTPATAAG
jgi:glucan biosynthesis protein C